MSFFLSLIRNGIWNKPDDDADEEARLHLPIASKASCQADVESEQRDSLSDLMDREAALTALTARIAAREGGERGVATAGIEGVCYGGGLSGDARRKRKLPSIPHVDRETRGLVAPVTPDRVDSAGDNDRNASNDSEGKGKKKKKAKASASGAACGEITQIAGEGDFYVTREGETMSIIAAKFMEMRLSGFSQVV